MNITKISVTPRRKSAKQVHCRGRLPVSFQQTLRVRHACLWVEIHTIDIIAAVRRKLNAVANFNRRTARFPELPSDTANFDDRLSRTISQYDSHLHHHAEHVANIIGVEFFEALRTIPALHQEGLAHGHFTKPLF